MSKKRTISKVYTKLIIKPSEIIELSKICYEPWKRELLIAQRKWRSERLPEIEKLIDKHNKDVKAKKSVYSFSTYLPIEENDKKVIIEKEKYFYIHTSQQVYEFRSNFKLKFSNETVEYTTPDNLKNLELEKATEIKFSTKTTNGNKSIIIEINDKSWNKELKYEIEGKNEDWIGKTKEEIESIIRKIQRPHSLTNNKLWIILAASFGLSLTLFKVLSKLDLLAFLMGIFPILNLNILNWIATLAFFIFATREISKRVNLLLPEFAIKEKYEPLNSGFIKTFFYIITAIISPLIWELAKYLYNSFLKN